MERSATHRPRCARWGSTIPRGYVAESRDWREEAAWRAVRCVGRRASAKWNLRAALCLRKPSPAYGASRFVTVLPSMPAWRAGWSGQTSGSISPPTRVTGMSIALPSERDFITSDDLFELVEPAWGTRTPGSGRRSPRCVACSRATS